MKLPLLPLLLLTGAAALAAPDPVDLQYRLSPGEAFSYRTVLKMEGEAKLPDEPKAEQVKAELSMRQRVKALPQADPGKIALESSLLELKLTDNGVASDAATPPPITTVITPRGKLLEMKGLDTLTSSLLPGLDATTFSSLLYNLPAFPEKAVAPGDSWADELPVMLPNGQKTMAQRKLTLVSVTEEKGERAARIRTELKVPINITVEGAGGGVMSGSQTGTGETRVSLADGMPLESRADMKLELTVKPASADPKSKADATVRVTTRLHVEARRVPDTPPPPPKAPSASSGEAPPAAQPSEPAAHSTETAVPAETPVAAPPSAPATEPAP